jgi:P-type E1-E2 ATPase
VVVYRCSPGDKALIVSSTMESGEFTLAIGDGANDVNMI